MPLTKEIITYVAEQQACPGNAKGSLLHSVRRAYVEAGASARCLAAVIFLQVQAQVAAAAAGCHASVLCRNNMALLDELLAAVGAAVPWNRQPVHLDGMSVPNLGHTCSIMKVQN